MNTPDDPPIIAPSRESALEQMYLYVMSRLRHGITLTELVEYARTRKPDRQRGEFTGFRDKEGKPIHYGDTVEYSYNTQSWAWYREPERMSCRHERDGGGDDFATARTRVVYGVNGPEYENGRPSTLMGTVKKLEPDRVRVVEVTS